MTKIEFYILEDETPKAAFRFSVELIQRSFQSKRRVFVHTAAQRDAEYMDELLWTQEPSSFLPHLISGEAFGVNPPIEIGYGQEPVIRPDVLVNLSNEIPRFHGQFEKVIEFAHGNDDTRQLARDRFKYYRDRGYPLQHHKRQIHKGS